MEFIGSEKQVSWAQDIMTANVIASMNKTLDAIIEQLNNKTPSRRNPEALSNQIELLTSLRNAEKLDASSVISCRSALSSYSVAAQEMPQGDEAASERSAIEHHRKQIASPMFATTLAQYLLNAA